MQAKLYLSYVRFGRVRTLVEPQFIDIPRGGAFHRALAAEAATRRVGFTRRHVGCAISFDHPVPEEGRSYDTLEEIEIHVLTTTTSIRGVLGR